MTARAPITKAEARRIAEVVKTSGVMARIVLPGGAIVELLPDIQQIHSPATPNTGHGPLDLPDDARL